MPDAVPHPVGDREPDKDADGDMVGVAELQALAVTVPEGERVPLCVPEPEAVPVGETETEPEREAVELADAEPATLALAPPPVALVDVLLADGAPGELEGEGVTCDAHEPALAAVVPPVAQHTQDAQPGVCTALALQQQPPRHRFVPHAKLLLHSSPGPYMRQLPDWKAHTAQPAAMAYALQQ